MEKFLLEALFLSNFAKKKELLTNFDLAFTFKKSTTINKTLVSYFHSILPTLDVAIKIHFFL